ncbi:MAG TPA: hypothetical protein VKB51_03965 [bacterium]|nr:hypothetical protein [bacterium]
MDAKGEQDIGALVEIALQADATPDDDADPLGVREEDYGRMARAFGLSLERMDELLRPKDG